MYFSWGNIFGHAEGSEYGFSQGEYNRTPAAAINANLTLSQDAARANLGAPYRMPTNDEFQELYNNCTREWTTLNGVNGLLFTSNVNGNTLFFPAAGLYSGYLLITRGSRGYYWSSSYSSDTNARCLAFSSLSVAPAGSDSRYYGFSVRPVADPALLTRTVMSTLDSNMEKDISPMDSDLEKSKSDNSETLNEDESR